MTFNSLTFVAFFGVVLFLHHLPISWRDGAWKKTWVAQRFGNVVTVTGLVLFLPLFRVPRGLEGVHVIGSMLTGAPNELEIGSFNGALGLTMLPLLMIGHTWLRDSSLEEAWNRIPSWGKSSRIAALLVGIAIAPRNDRAFIYFQF